uniref:Uncharacterized protein n=1 Tax=Glossina pallidipes TaxID=7398 RepID=A0A1B0A4C8_GLOPL
MTSDISKQILTAQSFKTHSRNSYPSIFAANTNNKHIEQVYVLEKPTADRKRSCEATMYAKILLDSQKTLPSQLSFVRRRHMLIISIQRSFTSHIAYITGNCHYQHLIIVISVVIIIMAATMMQAVCF